MRFLRWTFFALCCSAAAGSGLVSWTQSHHFNSWVSYQQQVEHQIGDLSGQVEELADTLTQERLNHLQDLETIDVLTNKLAVEEDEESKDEAVDLTWKGSVSTAIPVFGLYEQCVQGWNEYEKVLEEPGLFERTSIDEFLTNLKDTCLEAAESLEQWRTELR